MLALVYVIGLILDFVGYKLMHNKRKAIKKKQEKLNIFYDKALRLRGITKLPSDTAFILYKAPELAKTYATYSSRDRIARGATLNFAIASIVNPLILWSFPASFIVGAAFLALACIAYFAWFRFQSLSRKLKKNSVITIMQHGDFS